MASSKVMTTSTTRTANTELPRRESSITSLSALMADLQDSSPSSKNTPPVETTMDDLLRNIYPDNAGHTPDKTVDEVWKDIVAGDERLVNNHVDTTVDNTITTTAAAAATTVSINGNNNTNSGNGGAGGMTLEDFLSRAAAVGAEEEVRAIGYGGIETAVGVPSQVGAVTVVGGDYGDGRMVVSVGSGRGKRRAVQEPVVDKATQQKQRRMIKNRESAARSRERKQQYTAELESLVTRLEEENARLLKEEAEQTEEQFKQLLKNIIPVVESRRPKRALRRVHSMNL